VTLFFIVIENRAFRGEMLVSQHLVPAPLSDLETKI
jgi:hypothetical protein